MKHLLPILILLLLSMEAQSQCVSGNCQDGQGIFIFTSKAKYIGSFSNGEANGLGTCHYTDGTIYKGEWSQRFPEGRGEKIFSNGTKWSGNWKKGVPVDQQGFPIYFKGVEDTGIQTGCLSGDCKNGTGTIGYSDGSKYIGQFKNSQLNGTGKWYYPNESVYTGYFKDNLAHGQGVLVKQDGTIITGRWLKGEYQDDKLTSKGKVGCLSGNCNNGEGSFVYQGGVIKYVGSFVNNFPEGDGICYFGNNKSYKGEWAKGKFDGYGVFTKENGDILKGWWKMGTLVKEEKDTPPEPVTQKDVAEVNVWAVVIGIATYPHMPLLKYTDNDAYEMYAFLKSPEGGALKDDHIKVIIDDYATKENITKTLKDIYGKAGPNDLILLYYSGHGLKGAFLPVDYDGTNNRLEHQEINNILKNSRAKYKVIIADACHSGSYLAMKSVSSQNALINYYQSLAQADPGTALIMSSKSEENSLESNGLRQGVFSHFFNSWIKRRSGCG